ncbi:unnamed protein product [Linum trigynum]|uniref:Uncharacterized protein n=1 Tax=Linum trigynum TaxID=586398 RepID=A0AAV2CZZ2_9ROSI
MLAMGRFQNRDPQFRSFPFPILGFSFSFSAMDAQQLAPLPLDASPELSSEGSTPPPAPARAKLGLNRCQRSKRSKKPVAAAATRSPMVLGDLIRLPTLNVPAPSRQNEIYGEFTEIFRR